MPIDFTEEKFLQALLAEIPKSLERKFERVMIHYMQDAVTLSLHCDREGKLYVEAFTEYEGDFITLAKSPLADLIDAEHIEELADDEGEATSIAAFFSSLAEKLNAIAADYKNEEPGWPLIIVNPRPRSQKRAKRKKPKKD